MQMKINLVEYTTDQDVFLDLWITVEPGFEYKIRNYCVSLGKDMIIEEEIESAFDLAWENYLDNLKTVTDDETREAAEEENEFFVENGNLRWFNHCRSEVGIPLKVIKGNALAIALSPNWIVRLKDSLVSTAGKIFVKNIDL